MTQAFDPASFEASAGAGRAARVAEMDAICRETEFPILTGHGVDASVIEGIR